MRRRRRGENTRAADYLLLALTLMLMTLGGLVTLNCSNPDEGIPAATFRDPELKASDGTVWFDASEEAGGQPPKTTETTLDLASELRLSDETTVPIKRWEVALEDQDKVRFDDPQEPNAVTVLRPDVFFTPDVVTLFAVYDAVVDGVQKEVKRRYFVRVTKALPSEFN